MGQNFYYHIFFLSISNIIVDSMINNNDASPNSSRDPNVGPKTKQQKKKKVGAHSLTRSTSGVKGCVRALGWD